MQCYIYITHTSYFTNKCEIDNLDIIEHEQLHLEKIPSIVRKDIAPCNSKIGSDTKYHIQCKHIQVTRSHHIQVSSRLSQKQDFPTTPIQLIVAFFAIILWALESNSMHNLGCNGIGLGIE
jgi:hypothetical protein